MNKNIILLFSIIALSTQLSAQQSIIDTSENPVWIEMMQDPKANFFETQKAFEMYWEGRERQKGDGWKPFKRWEYFMSIRVDEEGNKPAPDNIIKEYQRYFGSSDKSVKVDEDHWKDVGPIKIPANGTGQPNGLGRLNSVAFHPTNANIIYVGSPAGGLWKTTNGTSTWKSKTDTLPTLGVSSIVVDYSNTSIVYIGTGDRDAGNAPGLGVWKSTNAGDTWSVSNTGMGNRTVGRLIMNPQDSMTLLAATNSGIYKSTDGAVSWSRTSSNTRNYKDIVYKPGDTSIVYATETGDFYRSIDGGNNWSLVTTGIPTSNRLVIGVSPDSSNYVYAVLTNSRTFKGLYRSTDNGQSFTLRSSTPNIMDYSSTGSGSGGQAWYNLCVAVDRNNVNVLYVGGVNIFKSTDGGISWSISAHWVGGGNPSIHADQHDLVISPINDRVYSGNDGGLYYTPNSGSSWIDVSSGLAIAQVYKIGQSAQKNNLVINGYQDNGTGIYDGKWRTEIGGDGMECIIDPKDSRYMYSELYYGAIRRSSNSGIWFTNIKNNINESGEWVTPYILRESDPSTMIAGFKNVWITTNVKTGSVSWTKISNSLGGTNTKGFRVLENSPADDDILYLAREDNKLYRSDNINAVAPTYTDITSSLPVASWPRDIEAHPFDANKAYIVVSRKVYQTVNKGSSWTNISGTLPNININCIVYDSSSSGDLYVGTDMGVFYKGSSMNDWIPFTGGMPTAIKVSELEIYYNSNRDKSRIKASTYGRGLWSSVLYTKPVADFIVDEIRTCINQNVQFTDKSTGLYTDIFWSFPGGTPSNSTLSKPSVTYSTPGIYSVSLTIKNYNESDSEVKSSYITVDSSLLISINPSATSINQGDSVELKASGATTYSWTPTNGLNDSTGSVVKASPLVTTTYTVLGTNAFCTTTGGQAVSVVTVVPVGINDGNFENGSILIYPNPASQVLSVKFKGVESGLKTVYLIDVSGRRVFEKDIMVNSSNSTFEIDVRSEKEGYYFLHIKGEKDAMIFKVLINHSF